MSYFTDKEIVILNQNYATAANLRGVLLNIFNKSDYSKTDIGQIIYDADKEHLDLFRKLLTVPVEYINGSQIFKDIKRLSYDKDGYDRNGITEEGYNRDGYDREGFNECGYDRDGYNEYGYNEYGYSKDRMNIL